MHENLDLCTKERGKNSAQGTEKDFKGMYQLAKIYQQSFGTF